LSGRGKIVYPSEIGGRRSSQNKFEGRGGRGIKENKAIRNTPYGLCGRVGLGCQTSRATKVMENGERGL